MIYTEFKCMLYEKLNGFDIKLIEFVVRYIVNQKKNKGSNVIFDFNMAVDYPNLNRAMMNYISEDKDAKDCFNL